MKYGIFLPQLGSLATRENVERVALEAESLGYDSLWVLERQLWPIKPRVRYPGSPTGNLPDYYKNVLDPIETLSYVAGITKKVQLGTSVINMLFHSPVILGRRLATLDVLSNGRLIVGFGLGWSPDEYEVAGVPFENRGKRADEFLEAIKAVWTQDVVEYSGKYYKIPPSVIGPKPVQKPHPEIYLGGFVPKTFSRTAKLANGWIGTVHSDFSWIEKMVRTVKEEGRKVGNDNLKILLSLHLAIGDSQKTGRLFSGSIKEIALDLKRVESLGVDHIILSFRGWDINETIDEMSELKRAVGL